MFVSSVKKQVRYGSGYHEYQCHDREQADETHATHIQLMPGIIIPSMSALLRMFSTYALASF